MTAAADALPPRTLRVVIVNYNSAALVAQRLQSAGLAGQAVTVVDNASEPDAVSKICAETGAEALLLPTNTGFAGGVNAALAHQPRDDRPVLLLNPDAEPTAADLAVLHATLVGGRWDAVAPVLVEPNGQLQVGAAGGRLTLWSTIVYFLFLAHLVPRLRGLFWTRRQAAQGGPAAWLCAACLLVRADAFTRFGPLPEDELVYAEDVAWGAAATARGARFILLGHVRVPHAKGASGGSAAWYLALGRLLRRRLGPLQGRLAVAVVRFGLATRRTLGRAIT